ncbi:hypothetical protein NDU88_001123 [Pleurodeles waltl]|uniref:Uncharacterized protein n=1 Tax=Pleurodeles waltl TaxID=8319 RepID=A0AAV7SZD9_PLEWA|nr:hypothetical protein NDU88_001123 [Pleurodeles waltl]
MERTPFRFCPKCHNKYPYTDQHLVCNLCLSPEHSEDTCEACRAFRSRKTLRDRRARRLQMASAPTARREFEEQEEEGTFSIQDSDSEGFDDTQTVSKTSKTTQRNIYKAQGTPLPPGHGSTHKIGDRPSAPKKAQTVPRSSDSGRDTGTQPSRDRESAGHKPRHRDAGVDTARRRDSGTETDRRREVSAPKRKKVTSEPKKHADKVSMPKQTASDPASGSYTEEHSLTSQMQKHRFEEELQATDVDHTQKRIFIQQGTGKISTLPPIRRKRRLEFQTEQAPQPKVVKRVTPPPSPPPVINVSPAQTPSHSPAHTTMSQGDQDQDAWDLYDAPVSDNSPEAYPTKPSPPEDSTAYSQVVARAAQFHNVSLHSEQVEDDFLFNTLSSTHSSYQSLPMLPGMLRHAKDIFKDPVKSRAITPRVEKKYKPPPTDPAFITTQLPPDSVVVGAARKRANSHTSGDAPPPDKESRKFDAAGKRVAAQAANQWRIANSQALLARYDRAHWDEMQHLIEHLPKDFQNRAKQVVEEGQTISNNQIRSSMDAADTAARTINTSVTIRRHAWLRTSGFKPEIQQAVLNMPFNEKELFGPEVDTAIEKLKKDTDTAKAMGALYSPQSRGNYSTFRKTPFRGGFRGQSTQASTSQATPSTYQGQYRGGFRGQYKGGQFPRNRGRFQSPKTPTTKQ